MDQNHLDIDQELYRAADAPLLHRTLEVCLLLIIAATALAYPLCLETDALQYLHTQLSDTPFYQWLYPWISCGFTPLIVKESLMLTFCAALVFVYVWLKIRGQWLGVEQSALAGSANGRTGWIRTPDVWLLAGLLYGAVSIAWSNVFHQSLSTWILFAAGGAIILITRAEVASPRFAVKFMVLCILCGCAIASIALFQHLDRIPFLPQSSDPRNRMSSLIGHNTGMSSWLMFPLSFSFYFMLTNRRLWARWVAAVLAVLFILVIIAAQSRAVWVLAAGICVVVPWQILRIRSRRLSIRTVMGSLAVGIALIIALSFSPQTNPMARLPVSLKERVTGHILNLDQLRRETRLRILVVSLLELFPKAPVFGTGLGSFAWEYPKAQGEYFTANPDTWLGTTTRRTDLAHNDYLQVLIETGIVGFGLLGAFLCMLGRDSLHNLSRLGNQRDRALWWALAAPAGAVALHALVDFPFHITPLALIALVSASLTTRLAPRLLPDTGSSINRTNTNKRKATLAAFIITAVIFSWLPWGWQALVGRVLVSDKHYNAGLAYLDEYRYSHGQTLPHRLAMLDRSQRLFREAVINNVFNGEAYQGQATAFVNRAALMLHEIDRLQSEDSPSTMTANTINALKMTIARDSESAITITGNQLRAGGLRYHYTYYLMGRAWRMQWELEKEETAPEDSKAYSNAVSALRMALRYNQADSMTIRELSDLLSYRQQTVNESQELQSQLFITDPWAADELLLQPAIELAREGEIPSAKAMLDPIVVEYPNHPKVLLARAWLGFYEAVWPPEAIDSIEREEEYLQWRREKLAPYRDEIAALPDSTGYKQEKERLELLYTAAAGEMKDAYTLAHRLVEENQWNREARAIYYWSKHHLYGGTLQFEDSLQYFRTQALLRIYFMTPRKTGLQLAVYTVKSGLPRDLQITTAELRRLTAFCVANNWWNFMKLFMPTALKLYPGDEKLLDISYEMEQRTTGDNVVEIP